MEVFKREGHEGAEFFIGGEVEHTPAYGKRTLFVVGRQPVDTIIKHARENSCTHIFMGANHYFETDINDTYWNKAIGELLDRGFWVSIEYEAHLHGVALKMFEEKIWKSRYFIPLLSVRIPYVQTSSPNLTIKIDDVNFKSTNDGVWCMHHTEATDSNRFTSWIEYGDDKIVGKDEVKEVSKPNAEPIAVNTKVETVVAEPVIQEVLNNSEAGLDTEAKPEQFSETAVSEATEAEAAEAYAETETSTKAKKAKKSE